MKLKKLKKIKKTIDISKIILYNKNVIKKEVLK